MRIDTWLAPGPQTAAGTDPAFIIGVEFDSLLAKIITSGETFEGATNRALRALREIRLPAGLKTNIEVLAGVMAHPDWRKASMYTT